MLLSPSLNLHSSVGFGTHLKMLGSAPPSQTLKHSLCMVSDLYKGSALLYGVIHDVWVLETLEWWTVS